MPWRIDDDRRTLLKSLAQGVMYIIVWEFTVRPGAEAAFAQLYGPDGGWVALFRTAAGYLGTELLRPHDGSRRYLTIDRWDSPASYAAFRESSATPYRALDAAGEGLTETERPLGDFTSTTR